MIATIITTIIFQNAVNPPGAVKPVVEYVKCSQILNGNSCPGQFVLAEIFSLCLVP